MRIAELREYAGRRGGQIVEEFSDRGQSGCKERGQHSIGSCPTLAVDE